MNLVITQLSKTYPNGVHALRGISLAIRPGMFGLLGPNGAGKSTLMRILATLQEADAGEARLGPIDVLRDKDALRRTLGYLPQEFGVYPKSTAEEMLDHFALLKGITSRGERRDTVAALLQQTNLWEARGRKLEGFSGGMRQRFGIAVALIGDPRLIIVDEPTAGLDPAERARFLNLLSELGERAVVILSTHIVEDVSELCTRMAIIERGTIRLEAEPLRAVEALRGRVWRRGVERALLPQVEEALPVISTTLVGGQTLVHVYGDAPPDPSWEPVEPDLKDVYFTVMKGIEVQPAPTSATAREPLPPLVLPPPRPREPQPRHPDDVGPTDWFAPPRAETPPPLPEPFAPGTETPPPLPPAPAAAPPASAPHADAQHAPAPPASAPHIGAPHVDAQHAAAPPPLPPEPFARATDASPAPPFSPGLNVPPIPPQIGEAPSAPGSAPLPPPFASSAPPAPFAPPPVPPAPFTRESAPAQPFAARPAVPPMPPRSVDVPPPPPFVPTPDASGAMLAAPVLIVPPVPPRSVDVPPAVPPHPYAPRAEVPPVTLPHAEVPPLPPRRDEVPRLPHQADEPPVPRSNEVPPHHPLSPPHVERVRGAEDDE